MTTVEFLFMAVGVGVVAGIAAIPLLFAWVKFLFWLGDKRGW